MVRAAPALCARKRAQGRAALIVISAGCLRGPPASLQAELRCAVSRAESACLCAQRLLDMPSTNGVSALQGLYDARDGKSEEGSTAEMAKWLGAPAVLVLDCFSLARSAAAMVKVIPWTALPAVTWVGSSGDATCDILCSNSRRPVWAGAPERRRPCLATVQAALLKYAAYDSGTATAVPN